MKAHFFASAASACLAFLFIVPTSTLLAAPPPPPPGACLYALDATAANAFQIAGAQSVDTACGVVSESSSSSAFEMEGAETLALGNHAQVSVVGGANLTGQTYLYDTISGKDVQAVQVSNPGDPLSSLQPPTSATIVGHSPTYYDMNSRPANDTIAPGVYCGGLTIGNTNSTAFTFRPGVYIMAGGGLTLNSQATVRGTGVTFYITSSAGWGCASSSSYKPITISGQVNAMLTAPTSGAFNGILFFGNRKGCATAGSCVDQINGGSTAILNGALYFKSDEIEITGSNTSGYTMLVADKVYINGNSSFGENGSPFDDITIKVSPATAALFAGQVQQFTATVNNTGNTAVTWTLSPSSAGSISSSGLYTAPSSIASPQTVTVTATSQADTSKLASATIDLLPPQIPVITWTAPVAITYGTALSAAQLDAVSNALGTFAYSPTVGTVLAAGSHTLSTLFTPANTTDYTTATASVTLTVNPATPTISISNLPAGGAYGGSFTAVIAYSGNGSPSETIASSTPSVCTVSGLAVRYVGVGVCSLTASATATTDYNAITGGVQSFNVAKAALTITANSASRVYGAANPVFGYTAAGFVNGDTSSVLSGSPSLSTTATASSPAGSYPITASAGTLAATNYSFNFGNGTLTVIPASLTITASSTAVTYGSAVPTITPSYSGFVNGDTAALLTAAPVCTTTYTAASSAGSYPSTCAGAVDGNYAISYVSGAVTVAEAAPTITWATPAAIPYGTAITSTQLDATANVPGTFVYSPAAGTIPSVGNQTLTVSFTPTNTTDYTTATASVTLTVNPVQCSTNGYNYARAISIDHTKVPNTDQINFPFLFNTTDPLLATIANGGHVANSNGYDIIFTSDPAGQNPLPYEMEEYNPATGQIVAWVQIPDLSHSSDTVIYLFYGNPNITASQQNPTAVWDTNYLGVWHLPNGTSLSANDSTVNANNGILEGGVGATPGEIDGAAIFDGSSGYITTSNAMDGPTTYSASIWFNTKTTNGGKLIGFGSNQTGTSSGYDRHIYMMNSGQIVYGNWSGSAEISTAVSPGSYNDGHWHYAVGTLSAAGQSLYIDGALVASNTNTSAQSYLGYWKLGYDSLSGWPGPVNSDYFAGSLDEVRVSSIARSADWIATEYANQSSPETFYTISAKSIALTPTAVTLNSAQSQQFTVAEGTTCPVSTIWSLSPSGIGTLTQNGPSSALFTAPASITTQQTVIVTATNSVDNNSASAVVTLMPPALNPTLTIAASSPSPYITGSTETFVAILRNQDGTAFSGIPVSFTVAGTNTVTGSGITDSSGSVSFSYSGTNSGTDTIQAIATMGGTQVKSGTVTAIWLVPSQPISTSTVYGAFFPTNGTCSFDSSQAKTPAFTEVFPTINFNPPSGTVPGNTSSVNVMSRPFTDVTTDLNGNYTGTIVAQGNGYQAGVQSMYTFEAVFTGEFTVANAGNTVFNFYDDDGFIFGIGNGATRVSGASINMPPTTVFNGYPSMGADNGPHSPTGNQVVVNFPAAGTYPYEVDYTECDGLELVLTMTQGATNPTGIAPTGSLTVTPNAINPLPFGGSQSFSVFVADASGNPVPNVNVSLVVTGVDILQLEGTTNSSGYAAIVYSDINPGTAYVQAVAFVSGMLIYSNMVTVPWTLPAASATGTGGSSTLNIQISAQSPVVLPSPLQLTGSVTDSALPSGTTLSATWSEVSGPGTVTFANPQQSSTTATFSAAGNYVLQLNASDTLNSGSAQISIEVDPAPAVTQGWIGSPQNGAQVSGIVPITVTTGEILTSCELTVYPAENQNARTALSCNTAASGTSPVATWDTTAIPNGSYWIAMQATDSNGNTEYSLAMVTVTGNYKPGRVTSTVTDLVVPANGLPIQIQRTYDSLNAGSVGDFGYGWNLGINVNLAVDNKGDVTFTLGGQRKTFYLTPQVEGCSPLVGCLFPWYSPVFTPEPGLHGTLTESSPGCLFDMLAADGECLGGGGFYTPPGYIYTDPNGTQYTISATGGLQSIVDRSGNGLTITPNGITSTTGLNVPFVRDAQGRITQITDPAGNVYLYQYDENGNLASVTYPNLPQPSTYTYDKNHYYLSGTDFRSNPLPAATYYAAGEMDASGNYSVAGKLASVIDAMGQTTSYTYNLATNTTVITYPPDASGNAGKATMVYDSNGDMLSSTDPLDHTTTNTYDINHNLLSTTDPLGHTTSYTYDANGNKTSTTYPATETSTNTTSYTNYNQYSEPTSTTDEDGNTRTFTYDANYNPMSVTDSLGALMTTQFNSSGQLLSGAIGYDITQSPARASQFSYDANGNLISKTDALGRTTSYTYNALGQKISMTEPVPAGSSAAAATTAYTYDAFGNLLQTQAPLGRTTSATYDANGNKITSTDARGNTTSYKYDALNRLIETDYSDGTKSTKTYDFRNNVVTETDQAGHVTLRQYDLAGRLISMTQADGTTSATTTTYTYDAAGRMTSQTDALGHTTTYTYDAAGNLLSTSGIAGNLTYAYDNARNRISMADGNGNTTQFQYDARKRLTVTTYPDQTTKVNAYDGPGNLISITDQAGNQVQYNYDAANQLTSVVQVNSPNTGQNTTVYGYDSNGNPITLEDANQHTTSNVFDLLSELTQKTLPDGTHTETRTYDSNGNLASVTHFNGATTTYTYDALNRLLTRTTPGEAPVSFTYTPTGQYASSTDASGTTTYTYDSMDRITSKATPEGTLNYTYDAAGHVASIASSNPNGASMAYTYDDLGRLATVTDNRTGGVTSYTYDNASNVATVSDPNGVRSSFIYDTLNRVTGLSSQPASYTYQRGPTGDLLSASESSGRQVSWSYDGIDRLTRETIALAPSKNNGTVSYDLDPVGNRLSDASTLQGVSSGSWSYNADDELSSESYDADGDVTSTGGKAFAYNSQNQMISMTAAGTAASMVYDAFGNRVAKTVNGVTTAYLVEDDKNPTGYPQVFDELTGGAVTRTYTYGLQRIDEEQVRNGVWTPSYYGYDGGGNVRNLTNSAGTVTDQYEYDAYGNSFTVSGTTPNNYLYRGEQFDPDLGLYYLRARYYNPATGRFMSRDPQDNSPLKPNDLHKYLYAGGDSVNVKDPTGRGPLLDSWIAIRKQKYFNKCAVTSGGF